MQQRVGRGRGEGIEVGGIHSVYVAVDWNH